MDYSNRIANFDMADEIAAPAAVVAMEEEDDEALDALDDLADIFRATIGSISDDEDAGVLDPDEAEELRIAAVEDYEDAISEVVGIGMEDEEMADYSSAPVLANFSAGNNFGAAVLELAEQEFEDPDDAIYAIAEHTGYEPEQILGLITGEYVPDEQLASEIAEVFESTSYDDGAYNDLLDLGQQARAEEGLDDEGNRSQAMEVDEEEAETENFSRYLADKDRRIQQLEAEFSTAQVRNAVSEQLMELEQIAQGGVQEGWFPPVAYREVFAAFKTDKDKLAAFSQVCEGNGVDLETELYATRKVLSLFERCGPQIGFGAYVQEDLTPEELDEAEEVLSQAERNVQARRARKNPIKTENSK